MRARSLTAVVLLSATAGCNSGVFGAGDDREPLARVHGRIEGDFPPSPRLRAGIVWAGVPVFVPYCHEHGPTPLENRSISQVAERGCRDPFEVVPGGIGPSVPFNPAGDHRFEIPLDHLPSAEVMVGTLEGRVAYGSVVLFDDFNQNGGFDLGFRCRRRDMGDPPPEPHDPLLASSFTRLNAAQTRIAYVEGEFDRDSFFYPHPNCTELPPRGFSLWTVGDLLDPNATCSVRPIDAEVVIEAEPREYLINLSCQPSERESFTRPPPDSGTGEDVIYECSDDGALVVADAECDCPSLRVYTLRGCFDESECTEPDWDLKPPPGWPCPLAED